MTSEQPSVEVTRSEERLEIGRRSEVVGRVRVAKRVVTEERQVTVTVRREELVVEELPPAPVTSSGGGTAPAGEATAASGPRASGQAPVLELVLSEEEVEVVTRVVPRERVRVFVDTVTDSVQVAETVAKEVVDVQGTGAADGPVDPSGAGAAR